jgi:integrase
VSIVAPSNSFAPGQKTLWPNSNKKSTVLSPKPTTGDYKMASVYKKKGRKKWYIAFQDENGKRREVSGFKDKQATINKAQKLERDAERKRAGLITVDQERFRQPLDSIIQEYLGEMHMQNRSTVHIQETKRTLETLQKQCKWHSLAQVRQDSLKAFLMTLKAQNRSARTLNSYLGNAKTFLTWCVRQHYLEENPIGHIPKARQSFKTRPRRPYTMEEFLALTNLPKDRSLVYRILGLSGLRYNELRQLTKQDLSPAGPKPTWHLRACITKGKRRECIPMLPECAQEIFPLWDSLPNASSPLFETLPRLRTLNHDLLKVGISKTTERGTVDWHSFRYFFCTQMAQRLPIQKVKILMRHRDIRMTCNLYMNLGLEDVGEDVWQAPQIL